MQTNITRRAALTSGVALATAIALPAAATPNPDSELHHLWAEYVTTREAYLDAFSDYDTLLGHVARSAGWLTQQPVCPAELQWFRDKPHAVTDAAVNPDSPLFQGSELRRINEEYEARMAEHFRLARHRQRNDSRWPAVQAAKSRADELEHQVDELRSRIMNTPASTYQGLRIKAAAVARDIDLDGDCLQDVPGDELFEVLSDDLRRLLG